jgi:CcmD family protein
MDYLEYLFAGFAVFWAGLFVYLLTLQFRLRALMRDMERLEERLEEYEAEEAGRAPAPRRAGPAEATRPTATSTASPGSSE